MIISDIGREEHLRQSLELQAEGYVELFALRLRPRGQAEILLYFTPLESVTWQGIEFSSYLCGITGYKQSADEEASRPTLTVFNPNGAFSRYVHAGWTDNAEIVYKRVLKSHIEDDVNSFQMGVWRINRTLTVTKQVCAFELRGAMDGQNFLLPARQFIPPVFRQVSM